MGREWLVTNGLGGYACGTLAGANTRRYHAFLMASLESPGMRRLPGAKIALPGLTTALKRFDLTAGILRTMAPHLDAKTRDE